MRTTGIFFLLFMIMSCSELIDPPEKLISKEVMAELLADFAINEQLIQVEPTLNIENSTRLEFKKRKITGKEFTESYKYYIATGEMKNIIADAQQKIIKKDPVGEKYINNKIKENKKAPEVAH